MKVVGFVSPHADARAQFASAWFGHFADPRKARARAVSLGACHDLATAVLDALVEVGLSAPTAAPDELTDDVADAATLLVMLGVGGAAPRVRGVARVDWEVADVAEDSLAEARRARDELRLRVERLVLERGWGRAPALVVAEEPAFEPSTHPLRVLFLYGSLRTRSYSRLLAEEAARILSPLGAEVRFFDPRELPVHGSVPDSHPKVQELRALSQWSEAQVWSSPEQHGAITGVMKNQIDWIPLAIGAVRPTQGRTLAVMQVCGGSQSFNAVNTLRLLGRWMRMFTIPNQSSVAKAYDEFHDDGAMKDSPYRDRLVDVMEELFKITTLLRDRVDYLTDRYSERRERDAKAVIDAGNPKHRIGGAGL
jgi:arsenic resistance protein ArsH